MVKRWFVHRNDQTMGPWSADVIRAALRDGTVDPFDLVNAEGSPVMRELVEIDEIFQTDKVEYTETAQVPANPSPVSAPAQSIGGMLALAEPNIEKRVASNRTRPSAPGRDSAAQEKGRNRSRTKAPQGIAASNVNYDRAKLALSENAGKFRDPQRYYLVDGKGRILGPKSAGEIQSLYYRGVLDQSVKVQKNQSEVSVPVGRFVEVYAQAKGGGRRAPVIGSHPISPQNAMSKPGLLKEFGVSAAHSVKILRTSRYLIMFSVLSLLLSTAWGVYTFQNRDTATNGRPGRKAVIINRAIKGRQNRPPGKPDQTESQLAPGGRSDGTGPASEANDRQTTDIPSDDQGRRIDLEADGGRGVNARPPRPLAVRRLSTPRSQSQSRPAPAPRPIIRTQPIQAPSQVLALAGREGQVVTLTGLRFQIEALERCDAKCVLPMTDAAGQTIHVKFFKDVYKGQLSIRSGGVSVTGRVLGGGRELLLTGVR